MLDYNRCQQNVEQTSIPKGFIEPFPIIREQLSVIQQRVLHYFLQAHQSIEQLSMAQTTIALKLNCSVRSVGRAIKRLVDLGLIYYWQRPYDTNLYMIEDILLEPATLQQLRILFRNIFLFSISFLLSRDNVRPLILDVNILSKCNEQTTSPTPRTNKEVLYLPQVVWLYDLKLEGEPNKKKTYEEFEALFTPWDLNMLSFTTEQQQQLEQYSQSTRDYAHKIFTKDMASGKAISSQFAYFSSICRNHAAKNKTPEKGYAQPSSRPNVGPHSVWKQEERIAETDFEWALNAERVLHKRMLDQDTHPIAATYPNPKLKFLSQEEQDLIMQIHNDCTCRDNIDYSLTGFIDIPFKPQPVLKRHELKEESTVSHNKSAPMFTEVPDISESPFISEDSIWEEV